MDQEQVTDFADILALFFVAVESGEPVPNDLAAAAWAAWVAIDAEGAAVCERMRGQVDMLQNELAELRFMSIGTRGEA